MGNSTMKKKKRKWMKKASVNKKNETEGRMWQSGKRMIGEARRNEERK